MSGIEKIIEEIEEGHRKSNFEELRNIVSSEPKKPIFNQEQKSRIVDIINKQIINFHKNEKKENFKIIIKDEKKKKFKKQIKEQSKKITPDFLDGIYNKFEKLLINKLFATLKEIPEQFYRDIVDEIESQLIFFLRNKMNMNLRGLLMHELGRFILQRMELRQLVNDAVSKVASATRNPVIRDSKLNFNKKPLPESRYEISEQLLEEFMKKLLENIIKDLIDQLTFELKEWIKGIEIEQKIAQLKEQEEEVLKDLQEPIENVNKYLRYLCGNQSLKIQFSEKDPNRNTLEVRDNGRKAFHLSEGERSLISFAYFIAKLEEKKKEKKKKKASEPIIWIDDPISSLDTNHIFSVYSLIHHKFSSEKGSIPFSQLFISTHNLEFLKYLKEVTYRREEISQYFMIVRNEKKSEITLMPEYLKKYTTEFNFLFEQIYQASSPGKGDNEKNYKTYYQFGNNARRFLECFLYFKYPNSDSLFKKIKLFFGAGSEMRLIYRIINEYSHAMGAVERSLIPLDIPEMEDAADLILKRVKENDFQQYQILCESIGQDPRIEKPEPTKELA